jgi:hypothetical protein
VCFSSAEEKSSILALYRYRQALLTVYLRRAIEDAVARKRKGTSGLSVTFLPDEEMAFAGALGAAIAHKHE